MGKYLNLPADDSNLDTSFICTDYAKVAVDDNIYVQQCARDTLDPYAIFEWKNQNTSNLDTITSTCKLKTSIAPSVSTVYLQIYNQTDDVWETLDFDNTSNADVYFVLSGVKIGDLSKYYNGLFWTTHRIYQKVEI